MPNYENYLYADPLDDPCRPEDESFEPNLQLTRYRETIPHPEGIENGC